MLCGWYIVFVVLCVCYLGGMVLFGPYFGFCCVILVIWCYMSGIWYYFGVIWVLLGCSGGMWNGVMFCICLLFWCCLNCIQCYVDVI